MTYIMLFLIGFYLGFALGTRLFGKDSKETNTPKKDKYQVKWKYDSEGRHIDD